jgi:tetratricopeptide (TPR) repeat protein
MRQLAARPMELVRSRGLQAGQREFAVLLTRARRIYGTNSVRVADLFTSFGVALYNEGIDKDDLSLKTGSAKYLQAAVPAYRAAFTPKSPEVALALNTYADVELALHPDNPSIAESLLEEVASIRLKALGPANLETRAAMLELAEVRGSPAVVRGDPERLQNAINTFEQLIAIAPRTEVGLSAPRVRVTLAQVYARNGESQKAIAELRRAQSEMQSWSERERCSAGSSAVALVASDLEKSGEGSLADQLTGDEAYLKLLRCTPPIDD